MKRITPEQVKLAYDKTGLVPINMDFIDTLDDGRPCGCALSACAIASGKTTFEQIMTGKPKRAVITEALDISLTYQDGFVDGFDGRSSDRGDLAEYAMGHEDGEAAAAVVTVL